MLQLLTAAMGAIKIIKSTSASLCKLRHSKARIARFRERIFHFLRLPLVFCSRALNSQIFTYRIGEMRNGAGMVQMPTPKEINQPPGSKAQQGPEPAKLGSFSSRFNEVVGESPSQYRGRDHGELASLPSCVAMVATRPRRRSIAL